MSKRTHSTSRSSIRTEDEYDKSLEVSDTFWEAAAQIDTESVPVSPKKTKEWSPMEGGSVNVSSRRRGQALSNMFDPTKKVLSRTSPTSAVSEDVQVQATMSRSISAAARLNVFPTTPKKFHHQIAMPPPPSTDRTKLARSFGAFGFSPKNPIPSPQFLRGSSTSASTASQVKPHVCIEVDSDDEEESEVSDMLIDHGSLPPTRPSLLESTSGSFASTSTDSSGSGSDSQEHWTSMTSMSSAGHEGRLSPGKRKRTSDASEIEVRMIKPGSHMKPEYVTDLFTTETPSRGKTKVNAQTEIKPVQVQVFTASAASASASSSKSPITPRSSVTSPSKSPAKRLAQLAAVQSALNELNKSDNNKNTTKMVNSLGKTLEEAKAASTTITKSFFERPFGVDIPHTIISHSAKAQRLFDAHNIAWGVQYELARGVTTNRWTWEKVEEVLRSKIHEFEGTNAVVAHRVAYLMGSNKSTQNDKISLWQELDREQEAIMENKGRGLGLMGEWCGQDDWFGGRIQQIARLSQPESSTGNPNPNFTIRLEPMEKRRSHRFARYCGSRRILQIRVSEDLMMNQSEKLKEFMKRKFVLCGRVFVPFHAKDRSVYLVENGLENWERKSYLKCGDQFRVSFADFINWHNPPALNDSQALSKYVTRFALGLSTSIPVLEFKEENMMEIPDIYGEDYNNFVKPTAEQTMTDGCGLINRAALIMINSKLNKPTLPVAIQGRIAGCKGLWLLHPTDDSTESKIWTRHSQIKIKLKRYHPITNTPIPIHRSHRIFELVAASQPSSSIAISKQSIVNLSHNGIPSEILVEYLEKGLVEEILPLVEWKKPKASLYLWYAINMTQRVAGSRVARVTAGISRAHGLSKRKFVEEEDVVERDGDDDDDRVLFDEDVSTYSGRNKYSKAPLSLTEMTLELVQAGFHPSTSKLLRDKLGYIIQETTRRFVDKYHIPLAESLGGFVVPDPIGILKEGEIYYRSSQSIIDPKTQMSFDVLTGDVVVGRYPIRVASDLQKVKAVNVPELYQWTDVIIASTRGTQSLASYLSGGDMDGDELFILREQQIVGPFKNQPLVPPPKDLPDNFQTGVESVCQFAERMSKPDTTSTQQQVEFQDALLLSLNENPKGLYSTFHENAVEKFGYDHPETIRLAYLFNALLDASKSGLVLRREVFEKDQKKYGARLLPECFGYELFDERATRNRELEQLPAFILNTLHQAGQIKGGELMKKYENAAARLQDCPDLDLITPYERATKHANSLVSSNKPYSKVFAEEMSKIRNHVEKAHDIWSAAVSKENASASTSPRKKKSKSKKSSDVTDDTGILKATREFASEVEGIVFTTNVEEIKASYAYKEWHASPFAFQMAFRTLCEIKARATNEGMAPCIRSIDELKTIPGAYIRAVERSYND